MGRSKAFLGLSTLIFILMAASIPFVQPSRISLQLRALTLAVNTSTKELQIDQARRIRNGGGAMVFTAVEDSARQVPAGPDPLHHTNNPIRP